MTNPTAREFEDQFGREGARMLDAVATGDNTVKVEGSSTSVTLPALVPVFDGDRCVVLEQPNAGALNRVILGPVDPVREYTPALTAGTTNPTFAGTPIRAGRYTIGGRVDGSFVIRGTLNNNPSGALIVSLPVAAVNADADGQVASTTEGIGTAIGTWSARNTTDSRDRNGVLQLRTATTVLLMLEDALDYAELAATTNDELRISGNFAYWPA